MKEQKQPTLMHVGIEEPSEKRKEVLNCAIDTLEVLKRYERFKKLRKEREAAKNELKIILKEIKTLYQEINDQLPHVEFPKEKRVEVMPRPEAPRVVRPAIKPEMFRDMEPQPKKESHREKIERDIQELRDKIARL